MKKEDVEFLFLDDNDDFEEDFMLNNKKSKKSVTTDNIINKKEHVDEIETLDFDEVFPKKSVKEDIETLEFEEMPKKKVKVEEIEKIDFEEPPKKKTKEEIVEKLDLEEEPVKRKIDPNETIDLEKLEVPRRRTKDETVKENKVEVKSETKTEVKKEETSKKEKEEVKEEKPSKTKKEKKTKADKPKKEKKMKKEKKPKKKIKKSTFITMLVFNSISIVFILGCCVYYGSRMIHYYKKFNPKSETGEAITLIASSLTSDVAYQTEGEGLYRISGSSVFKGEKVNNHVKFSNLDWRIVSINSDGSIELVLDEPINALMFDNTGAGYDKSDVNKYLNEKFIKNLNIDYLTKTSFCMDEVEDIQAIKCTKNSTEYYVRLLSINEFINSFADSSSYLSTASSFWLSNSAGDKAWHTSSTSVSISPANETYLVRPVVRLANTNVLVSGDGTKEKPYQVEKTTDKYSIGSYVQLDEDKWIIYDTNDKTISLALANNLSSVKKFSNLSEKYDVKDETSVAYYLNNTYLESLSYKDIINENNWNIGTYENSYKDIEKETISAKVGMLSIADAKIGNLDKMFYTLTPAKAGYVYYFDNDLIASKVSFSRNVKPAININKLKIKSGTGSQSDPYILEMEA